MGKMNDVDVVYTMWDNLHKTADMEVDFRAEREGRDKRERDDKKKQYRKEEDAKKAEEKARKEAAELKSYDRLMTDDNMTSNKDGEMTRTTSCNVPLQFVKICWTWESF